MDADRAISDFIYAWRIDSASELASFLNASKQYQRKLIFHSKLGKSLRCIASLAISYTDYATDFLLAAYYFGEGKTNYGMLTIFWPLLVILFQTYLSIASGDAWYVHLASCLGLKSFVDTWRVVSGKQMLNGGANLQPILSLSMVRGVELSCESVPQTCVQVYLMIQSASDGNGVDFTPLPAIVTSLLAAGFISANVDYDMDCSAYFRKMEPVLYGFLPDKKSSRLLFVLLHMIHLACHCGLVVLSSAYLLYASPRLFIAWFAFDFIAFTCLKFLLGTFAFYKRISRSVSHIVNLLTFITVNFTPLYLSRNPYSTVCGMQHTIFVSYNYVKSVAMIYLSWHIIGNSHDEIASYFLKLAACLIAISLGFTAINCRFIMKTEYSWMWWTTYNLKRHFSEYIWDTFVYDTWGDTLDDHRANALSRTFSPIYYLHDVRVKEWLREKWPQWESDPPSWFNQSFVDSLHPSVIPQASKMRKRRRRRFSQQVVRKVFPSSSPAMV